jgi:hypothetical protein
VKPPFEPARLDGDPDVPEQLKSALSALAAERPDERALRRMRDSLGSQLEAQPPELLDSWLASAVGKSVVGVVLMAGLAGLLGVQLRSARQDSAARRAANGTGGPSQPAPPIAAVPSVAPARAFAVQPAPSPVEAAPEVRKPSHAPRSRAGLSSNADHRRAAVASFAAARRSSHDVPVDGTLATQLATQDDRQPAPLPAAPSDDAHASSDATSQPAADAPARVQANAETALPTTASDDEHPRANVLAPPKPSVKSSPAPLDEPALLQRARRLASSQPLSALQRLDEHKRRFPNGMLSSEREVLAIGLLQALGRDAEAAQRAQAFRAEHPDSVYLRRVRTP